MDGSCDSAYAKRNYLLLCTLTLILVMGKVMYAANFFLYDNILVPMLLVSLKPLLEPLHVLILLTGNLDLGVMVLVLI